VEVRTLPIGDDRFRADAEAAVGEVIETTGPMSRGRMDAVLPEIVRVLRRNHPGAWARWQNPMASESGVPLLYVFRDAPLPRDAPPPGPRLPPDPRRRGAVAGRTT